MGPSIVFRVGTSPSVVLLLAFRVFSRPLALLLGRLKNSFDVKTSSTTVGASPGGNHSEPCFLGFRPQNP